MAIAPFLVQPRGRPQQVNCRPFHCASNEYEVWYRQGHIHGEISEAGKDRQRTANKIATFAFRWSVFGWKCQCGLSDQVGVRGRRHEQDLTSVNVVAGSQRSDFAAFFTHLAKWVFGQNPLGQVGVWLEALGVETTTLRKLALKTRYGTEHGGHVEAPCTPSPSAPLATGFGQLLLDLCFLCAAG
jgi:hypothetical protein